MTPETNLLRQVHPSFVQNGQITSQVFRPTPKDESQLSVENGELISAVASFERFVASGENRSVGVMAVTFGECSSLALAVIEDGDPYPEHCSIDFGGKHAGQIERASKILKHQAQARGWLHRAP